MAERTFTRSSKGNPCLICGRTKDSDCRLSDDLILCRIGATNSPPTEKPGTSITASDGSQWICRGPADDTAWIQFSLAGTSTNTNRTYRQPRPNPFRIESPAAMAAIAGSIDLARLPGPLPEPPPDHLPNGYQLPYSPTQRAMVQRDAQGKKFPVQHLTSNGDTATWAKGAGPDPWPLWRHAEAVHHGPGHWIAEAEGEKCADWLRAGGLIAISQPGHAVTIDKVAERYQPLKRAGISGIVYLADNDDQGRKKAQTLQQAAAAIGLPFLILHAGDVWPGLPAAGSIDDAPGTPAERVAAIQQAIPDAIAQDQQQQGGKPSRLNKAELQAFLQVSYQLEFNELTRDCEIDGTPMGSRLHLADSFLAQQHGLEITKQAAADSFEFVAKSNPYNPVRRYLLGLRDRTDLQLISMRDLGQAFGIHPADTVSHRLLAAHLAGAVHRGLEPGHKHDQLLVLTGPQGNLKSSTIEALAPSGWYDSATRVSDLESKDTLAKINSAWLFEFDECEHTLQRSTASEFKGFITRRNDNYVEKYEKQSTRHDRRAVLFGTTNHSEFLNDSTGNRRVWVIDTEGRPLDPDWVAANRDSIWATVMTWIDWGLKNWLSVDDELAIAAAERAEQANLSDPWEVAIAAVLENWPIHTTAGISQEDLINRALRLPADRVTRDVQMRVTRIVTGSAFLTHDSTVQWKQKKRRYSGGRLVSGYTPTPAKSRPAAAGAHTAPADDGAVPTVPTGEGAVPTDLVGVGTAETPWLDRRLLTLFQPVPTFSLSRREIREEGVHAGADGALHGVGLEVGTGWNTPENPSAAVDLAVPTGLEHQGGWDGTPPSKVGTTPPTASEHPNTVTGFFPKRVAAPAAAAQGQQLASFQPDSFQVDPIPRVPTCSTAVPTGRNGQTLWQETVLTTLFQRSKEKEELKEEKAPVCAEGCDFPDPRSKVGTSEHPLQNPSAGSDLPVPTLGTKPGTPSEQTTPSAHFDTRQPVLTPTEQAANAARSNLTAYKPGDTVYVAHQRLRHGQLHQASVTKVTNASISFTPPFQPAALLIDPTDPDQGHLQLPQPLASASTTACTPQLGTAAGCTVTRGQDGVISFTYTHSSGDTITRTVSPVRIRLDALAGTDVLESTDSTLQESIDSTLLESIDSTLQENAA